MTAINEYMNDGANYQAQAVLAFIRAYRYEVLRGSFNEKLEVYDTEIEVGRFENCREQGYVFTIKSVGKQKNYAVYQHRNSDQIIVLISNTVTIDTPNIDECWKDKGENATKYDYDKAFGYGEIYKCTMWIIDDMKTTINGWYNYQENSEESSEK